MGTGQVALDSVFEAAKDSKVGLKKIPENVISGSPKIAFEIRWRHCLKGG